ncbi:MAG: GyrI-like domain-containing protein [Acidobacteriota bacterium]
MSLEKLDLYQLHKDEYITPKAPTLVEIKPARYLTITGRGEPGGAEFSTKLGALYNVVFTIKMEHKFAGKDYKVCKLEGLWWADKPHRDFLLEPKDKWNWKLIIRTPDFVTIDHLHKGIAKLREKGKSAEVSEVRLETIAEGLSVQMLHVGSYGKEEETITRMKEYAADKGLKYHGLHHEIYLSDPRRVAEPRLKTILRNPVH